MKLINNINETIEKEINEICTIENKNKTILVLPGGGMNGLVILGAIKYLEELDIIKYIEIYAGTSIGLIISVLLIAGYSASDIYKFTKIFDMSKSINFDITNLFQTYSFNKCDHYEIIITELLKNKNINANMTLLDFYKLTKKKLIGTTVCLTTRNIEYISYENYPEINIITLIRMSTAVPVLFPPVIYNEKIYVDGGLINNFPIILFENELDKVIGIHILSDYYKTKEIKNIIDYILTIINIYITTTINDYKNEKYKNIVYNLNVQNSRPFTFDITSKDKKNMFISGYNFMKDNFMNK
jgi:predicted acylesterase/phospholipase RssA